MNFSDALINLKKGKRITRKCFENVCIVRIPYPNYLISNSIAYDVEGLQYQYIDCAIVEEYRAFNIVLLNSGDLLAEDWEVLEDK